MEVELSEVGIDTVAQGAAAELFSNELAKVVQNICDPNTDPEKTREIVLRFKFEPNEQRDAAGLTISVVSKLAPFKAAGTAVFLGRRHGRYVAVEHNPKQLTFDDMTPRSINAVKEDQ